MTPPKKRWSYTPLDLEASEQLQRELRIHPILCQLLTQRGIYTYEQAQQFFRPQLNHLHSPFLMTDMGKAVERIERAIANQERILVYGDYDVDGTTAAALVYTFLHRYHSQLDYYIPDRQKEGYGISMQGVEYAHAQGFSLLIALDCGISGHAAIAQARALGIDTIVCDHHLPGESLPAAYAILNPKRADCDYPYKELSGCALGFKLVQGLAERRGLPVTDIEAYLDWVVVSLACDYVSLTGENRVLAYWGLKRLNEAPSAGLLAMKKAIGRGDIYTIRDIVFGIGPLINAAGRIEHAKAAVELLLATDAEAAEGRVLELLRLNQERRDIEANITLEAKELIAKDITFGERVSTVLYQPHWHKGVIGIVASRLIETYPRPTIVLTLSEGKVVGSARSVGNFDIHAAIEACSDCLLGFGGHTHAAGLSLSPERVEEFMHRFDAIVRENIAPSDLRPSVQIDLEVDFKVLGEKFWNILRQFEPFGPDNMRPVFLSKMVRDTGYSRLVGGDQQHLKLVIRQGDSEALEGIAFGMADYFELLSSRRPFHLCYVLEENHFGGEVRMQLQVRDMLFN